MTALELLRRLYTAGVDVGLNSDGGVRVTRNQPPPDLLAELKEQRDDVAELLKMHGVGDSDSLLKGMSRKYVSAPDCLAPNGCACLGPCANFLTLRPCDSRKGRTR